MTQLQNAVLAALRIVVRAPLLFLGGRIMAIVIVPRFAPFIFVATALEAGIFFALFKKSVPLFARVQEKIDRLNTIIWENLAGIRVIRAFTQSARGKERFFKASQDLAETTLQAFLPVVTFFPLVMLIMNLSIVAVLEVGGRLVIAERMKVGSIMVLTNYVFRILFPLTMIGHIITFVSRAGASGKRVIAILEKEITIVNPEHPDLTPITRGEVVFDNVSFSYNGDRYSQASLLQPILEKPLPLWEQQAQESQPCYTSSPVFMIHRLERFTSMVLIFEKKTLRFCERP